MRCALISSELAGAAQNYWQPLHVLSGVTKSAQIGLMFLAAVTGVRAHDPGISTAQGLLKSDVFELTTGFAPADAQQLLPESARPSERWSQAEFEIVRGQLTAVGRALWEVRVGGTAVEPREIRVHLADGDSLNFHFIYPRPAGNFTMRAVKLGVLPPGHRQFVIIADEGGWALAKKLLSTRDDLIEVRVGLAVDGSGAVPTAAVATQGEMPTAWGFVRLGIEHIWTGYDHLLFLFALLVVCWSFRSIVAIVSCFTLAHSLTLALAVLNWVNLPSRITEPAIAASIVFFGVENLFRRGAEPPGRWALTFVFGLIHGFGFASVLRDLGVGGGGEGVAIPLLTFNLGVEIGQVAVAAIVLPVVWRLRKNKTFVSCGLPALSFGVSLAGLYWLLQRTIFA
ncbi:MAG: HupE/UreJ family protein [Opitutus sp.]|nr:HupE/UreJ family protein [Opitutus sp.]